MGEPTLVLARDHLERDARPVPHVLDDIGLVARDAQAGRADRGDGARVEAARLVGHLADGLRGPVERFGADLAGCLEPLTQPGHHGPVDDRPPGTAVRVDLRHVELGRVRAGVDHGVPLGHVVDEHPQSRRDVVVDVGAEAERLDRGQHRRRVRGLDGDGRRPSSLDLEHGDLGQAAGHRVAGAPLADEQGAGPAGRTDPGGGQGRVEVQALGRHVGRRAVETPEGHARGLRVERERRLEDRFPPLEPGRVRLAQDLDVHQPGPDLDVVPAAAEQVELLALLHGRLQGREDRVGGGHVAGERAPLPARDDLAHGPHVPLHRRPVPGRV